VISFRIKNYKAIIREKGFKGYRKLLDRFCDLIREKSEDQGMVHILSLNKVVFLLVERDFSVATALVGEVKSAVAMMFQKEKARPPLTFSPLRTTYPNESRSVEEILQLIE
jgi:hypothetical protein